MFANVSIINVPISLILEYKVPEKYIQEIAPGMVVVVPLANRKAFGVILQISKTRNSTIELEELCALLDSRISISPMWLEIAGQLAEDLIQPVGRFLEKMLPRNLGYTIEKTYSITIEDESKLPIELIDLQLRYGNSKILANRLSGKDQRTIEKFSKIDLIHPDYRLSQKISHQRKRKVYLALDAGIVIDAGRNFGRDTEAVERRLEAFDYIKREGPVEDQWIFASSGCNSTDLKWLIKHGLIKVIELERSVNTLAPNPPEVRNHPNYDQPREDSQLIASFEENEIYLVKHDRGAEILNLYFSMIQKQFELGGSCILIFPTIFEVEAAANYFEEKTGKIPEIFHSKLSDSRNSEVWNVLKKGDSNIIFGTTDALFCQIPHPGLIIIDEPQDCRSFGQQSFVYNAMSIADRIHQHFGTINLYSSIQPSVKDWFEARYRLIRNNGSNFQFREVSRKKNGLDFQIVDMATELKNGNKSVLSLYLQNKIQESLDHHQLTILYLNRKGYSNYVFCRDCGYVRRCDTCGSILTIHSNEKQKKLMEVCVNCGAMNEIENQCPICGGSNYRPFGAGIERVEETCREMFPKARIARWEYISSAGKFNEILYERILAGQVDIVIGTSGFIKNIHLPKIGTIGLILAESSLNTPDLFKQEVSFKILKTLISQSSEGTAIVLQTYQPNERLWAQLKNLDDKAFIDHQLELRSRFKLPPFGTIVKLTYREHQPDKCLNVVRELERQIIFLKNNKNIDDIQITLIPPDKTSLKKTYSSHLVLIGNGLDFIQYLNFQPGWRVDLNPTSIY